MLVSATGQRKEEENSCVENNKKKKSLLIWVTELMKQSFSGVFCFLGKQKRESRHINASVWIPKFWRGWKMGRSLSQRWLLENNDALLPWAHAWLLFLSLKMVERKQWEAMSVPVTQQCCLVGRESVRCMVAMPGKRGESSHRLDQMMWAWTVPGLALSNSSKIKGGF